MILETKSKNTRTQCNHFSWILFSETALDDDSTSWIFLPGFIIKGDHDFTILTVALQSGSILYGFVFSKRFKFNRGVTAVKTRSRSEPTKKEYPQIEQLKTEYRQGYQNIAKFNRNISKSDFCIRLKIFDFELSGPKIFDYSNFRAS